MCKIIWILFVLFVMSFKLPTKVESRIGPQQVSFSLLVLMFLLGTTLDWVTMTCATISCKA